MEVTINSGERNGSKSDVFIDAVLDSAFKKKVSITVTGCCGNCCVTDTFDEDELFEAIMKSKRGDA